MCGILAALLSIRLSVPSLHIAFLSNSAWNILHFRRPILDALLARGDRLTVIAPADGYEEQLRALGVEFFPLAMQPSGTNPLLDALWSARLIQVLRRNRPDVVLTFTIKPNVYGSLACRVLGIRSIATVSGLGTAFLKGGLLTSLARNLFRFALRTPKTVFFQNNDDRTQFVESGLVRANQARLVAGSGIDTTFFVPTPIPPRSPMVFLQIGRILGDKGVRECAEAAKLLKSQGFDFRLVLLGQVGAANPSAIPIQELQGWIENGFIEHHPSVDDVRPFITDAHAIVLASYREGLPRSLLEGGAMGRLLIATDVAGCRDLVTNGENGFLCEPHSASSLATALRAALLLDRESLEKMGNRSRLLVERNYDQSFVSSTYLEEITL